jgi:hypothetical protein
VSTTRKTASSFFQLFDNPDRAPQPSQLLGRRLLPEPFVPERGRPIEADGVALSKFGGQFRVVFSGLNGVHAEQVPLGLVRLAEALNADTDTNLAGLAHPVPKYTEYGVLWTVPLIVNTPLLLAWLINGRALRRLAARLKGAIKVVTTTSDHPHFSLPAMQIEDADQVLELVDVQRELLRFQRHTPENRDFVETIASQGVLNPPEIVFCELSAADGGSAWTAQAMEGARRTFAAQLILSLLMGRGDASSLATQHWLSGGGEVRDLRPDDLRVLDEALQFAHTDAAGYFPGRDARVWLDNVAINQPAAVAWQLLRTMRINLVIAVDPTERSQQRYPHPVSAVVQEFIRSQHVPGKSKRQWDLADVAGQAAIAIIDRFDQETRVAHGSRSVWLGETDTTWDAPYEGRSTSTNRLVEATRLIAALTTEGAVTIEGGKDGLRYVNDTLRDNAMPVSPKERARVAASQAVVVLDQSESGRENALAATLESTFRHPMFWRTSEHPQGNWTALIGEPLDMLAAQASAESEAMRLTRTVDAFGPAQRALGALGAVALAANPEMLVNGTALSRTGRGGGGHEATVSAADPPRLLAAMLREQRGIEQLVDAILALVAVRQPILPVDRHTGEPLIDLGLRKEWLGDHRQPDDDKNPQQAYLLMLHAILNRQRESWDEAGRLRTATTETIFNPDLPEDQQSDEAEVLFETIGVPADLADEVRTLLRSLEEFFVDGRALGRAAARFGRPR